MAIQGPKGLPCSLEHFSSWLSKATEMDGSGLHLDQFEKQWRDKVLLWSFHVAIIVLSYFFWKFIGRLADKEIAEKEEQERMRMKHVEEEALGGKEDRELASSGALRSSSCDILKAST